MTAQDNSFALECFPSKVRDIQASSFCRKTKPGSTCTHTARDPGCERHLRSRRPLQLAYTVRCAHVHRRTSCASMFTRWCAWTTTFQLLGEGGYFRRASHLPSSTASWGNRRARFFSNWCLFGNRAPCVRSVLRFRKEFRVHHDGGACQFRPLPSTPTHKPHAPPFLSWGISQKVQVFFICKEEAPSDCFGKISGTSRPFNQQMLQLNAVHVGECRYYSTVSMRSGRCVHPPGLEACTVLENARGAAPPTLVSIPTS